MHKWNDGLLPAGRRPRLYLAKGGEAVKFTGENIAGFCAVAAQKYEKNGKWSNTTYTLDLAPGVRALEFVSPMHGTWGDSIMSWGQACEQLGLPIDAVQSLIRAEYAATAKRLDDLEAFAAATPHAEVEVVVISFGSPTNRAIRDGYWSNPKSGQTSDGRTVTVRPGPVDDWRKPEIVEPSGASVLSSDHRPGMHGGYWTVKVAVPAAVESVA